jgi:hypothetical protein
VTTAEGKLDIHFVCEKGVANLKSMTRDTILCQQDFSAGSRETSNGPDGAAIRAKLRTPLLIVA